MNYSQIRSLDIANGKGCRIAIFCSGCTNRCVNCFQPETWDFNYGKEFTEDTLKSILELAKPNYIAGLSCLGGEPLHPKNREEMLKLTRKFKEAYPEKDIWLWTGYEFDKVIDLPLMKYVDILVDGPFIEDLKDLRLKWRGSSNQRVIDVQASLESGEVVEIA
jgi:anaerobic ribonucleoside-triphosphate reductase activating protein